MRTMVTQEKEVGSEAGGDLGGEIKLSVKSWGRRRVGMRARRKKGDKKKI